MKIWILQTGEPLHIDGGGLRPMRAMNLSDEMVKRGHEVTLWSSNFDHFSKNHRYPHAKTIEFSDYLRIQLIGSKGYKSHIGLGRLLDHAQLAWNLKKMLRTETAPDVAFIGYPPIEPAWIMSKWLNKRGIPFLLDVKDAWPQVLVNSAPKRLRPLAALFFYPYQKMFESSLRKATGINSITAQFLKWCQAQAKRDNCRHDLVTPLTSPETKFSEIEIEDAKAFWDTLEVKEDKKKRIYFVGTLNYLFDFAPVINAAKNLDIQIIVAGDGPQRDELLEKTRSLPNFILPGWISSCQSMVLASRSTFAIAPIISRDDFELSIPNKFIDAFRHGKPILTSLNGIAAELIRENSTGVIYSQEIVQDLLDKLIPLIDDNNLILKMSESARDLYLEKFEFVSTYNALVENLENISKDTPNNV